MKERAPSLALQPIPAVRALGVVEAHVALELALELPLRPAEHHPLELRENRPLQPLDEPIRPRVARQRAAVLDPGGPTGGAKRLPPLEPAIREHGADPMPGSSVSETTRLAKKRAASRGRGVPRSTWAIP